MRRHSRFEKIDQHIVDALTKLPKTMINKDGRKVVIRDFAIGKETGIEHISNGMHGLQVKDIMQIPHILKNPIFCCTDLSHKYRRNYYGKKMYKNMFKCYIKIVTHIRDTNTEEIITVYLVNKIKSQF